MEREVEYIQDRLVTHAYSMVGNLPPGTYTKATLQSQHGPRAMKMPR